MLNPIDNNSNVAELDSSSLFKQRSEAFDQWNEQISSEKDEIAYKVTLKIFTELKDLIVESISNPILNLYTSKHPLNNEYSFDVSSRSFAALFKGCLPENSLISHWQGEIRKINLKKIDEDEANQYSEISFMSSMQRSHQLIAYSQMNDRMSVIAKLVQENLTACFAYVNEQQEEAYQIHFSTKWHDKRPSLAGFFSKSPSFKNLYINIYFRYEDEKFDLTRCIPPADGVISKLFDKFS